MESDFDPQDDINSEENKEEVGVEEEIIKISADELIGKLRSKADIYNFLTLKYQLFLPPYEETKLSRTTKIMSIPL